MRWICFWCAVVAAAARAQDGDYYAPQTFRQHVEPALFQPLHRPWEENSRAPERRSRFTKIETPYQNTLFAPAGRNDAATQGSISEHWRPAPAPVHDSWREPEQYSPVLPRHEPWRPPQSLTKEQKATILHHKQSLSSEGSFRFEYASDNGQAAGEVIEPDGSRVGAYQYKDPSGQLVKLKYRAGKEGFQILEGSHLPKSPEPIAPPVPDHHSHQQAYEQQVQQYQLQQQYDQRPVQQSWSQDQGRTNQGGAGGQYFVQNSDWRPQTNQGSGREDDGQYRENDVEQPAPGPHSFGSGYAFSFEG